MRASLLQLFALDILSTFHVTISVDLSLIIISIVMRAGGHSQNIDPLLLDHNISTLVRPITAEYVVFSVRGVQPWKMRVGAVEIRRW